MTALAIARPKVIRGLDAVWSVFWSIMTLPIHFVMRMAGGKGFCEKTRTPVWAIVLVCWLALYVLEQAS